VRPPGVISSYVSPITKPYLAAASRSIVNSPGSGAVPRTSVKALNCGLSIQLKASCGGPVVGIVSPSGLIGRTALSPDSMLATASATPSTPATVVTASGGSGGGSPKSAVLRTSRSTPAVTSSETFVNVLRSPSPSTKAETTKLTASVMPRAVSAKRTLLASRCLMVRRNMAVSPVDVDEWFEWYEWCLVSW
jgi:hypothetical protein